MIAAIRADHLISNPGQEEKKTIRELRGNGRAKRVAGQDG